MCPSVPFDLLLLPDSVRKNGPGDFALLVASAQSQAAAAHEIEVKSNKIKLTVEYGDHADALRKAVAALQEVRLAFISL